MTGVPKNPNVLSRLGVPHLLMFADRFVFRKNSQTGKMFRGEMLMDFIWLIVKFFRCKHNT